MENYLLMINLIKYKFGEEFGKDVGGGRAEQDGFVARAQEIETRY